MDKREYQSLKDTQRIVARTLKDQTLSFEERSKLEISHAQLAGALLSTWLPIGIFRKLVMFVAIVFGIYFLLKGEYFFAFIFILITCYFSPRIIGEFIQFIGRIFRIKH